MPASTPRPGRVVAQRVRLGRIRATGLLPLAALVGLVGAVAVGSTSTADLHRSNPMGTEPRSVETEMPRSVETEISKELHLWTTSSPPKGRSAGLAAAEAAGVLAGAASTFVPVEPYRAIDSRQFSNGDMFPGVEVWFDVWTDLAGKARIPSDIKAVVFNLTISNTLGTGGYLAVFPADLPWPGNSSINWSGPGLDLSNGGVVAVGNLTGPGQVSVYAGMVPNTRTFFMVDVTGYFV